MNGPIGMWRSLPQRIRQLKGQSFGNPSTAEEAVQRGNDGASGKDLQELETQFEAEKKEYDEAVSAYQVSLQQLSIALGQIKNQAGAFTVEQRALAITSKPWLTPHRGYWGTRFLSVIVGVHLPKAIRESGSN